MPSGIFIRSEVHNRNIGLANLGKHHSEESKKKMSESHKGITAWNKGKHLSDETKEKLRLANVGKKLSFETKEKIRLGNLGKRYSIETRKKMSELKKGNNNRLGCKLSEETKRKIGIGHIGKYHSEETKKLISRKKLGVKLSIEEKIKRKLSAKSGESSHLWRGGITPFYRMLRTCFEYRQWRSDVFTRDNFTCQWCGDNRGGNLEVDHISPLKLILQKNEITNMEQAVKCEELWNINNGRTLCRECHKKTDTYGYKNKDLLEKTINERNVNKIIA